MKKILIFALAIALAFTVLACAKKADTEATEETPQVAQPEQPAQPQLGDDAAQPKLADEATQPAPPTAAEKPAVGARESSSQQQVAPTPGRRGKQEAQTQSGDTNSQSGE